MMRWALPLVLVVASCGPTQGCMVGRWMLAEDSTLPSWFEAGVDRKSVTVSIDFYSAPGGSTARVTMRGVAGPEQSLVAIRSRESFRVEHHVPGGPPAHAFYYVLTWNGISELFQGGHTLDGTLWLVDDPTIRQKAGLTAFALSSPAVSPAQR